MLEKPVIYETEFQVTHDLHRVTHLDRTHDFRNWVYDVFDNQYRNGGTALEQNLIKQLKPRYNVLLRDDKSFPNILVSKEHSFPQLKKHRGNKKKKDLIWSFRERKCGKSNFKPVAKGVHAKELFRQYF